MTLRRPCSFLVALVILTGACSGPMSLSEAPLTDAPSVDGSLAEWGDRLTALDNDAVSMGALSTDSLLYVAVLVRDRALVQTIAQQGLVVWIDPSGGTTPVYGVQYPLGVRRQQAGRAERRGAPDAVEAVSLDELEVLRGDTLRTRIPARFSSGLRGEVTLDSGSLICEVALPVGPAATSEHSLATPLGRTVGLGLQTPTAEENAPPEVPEPDIAASSGRTDRPSPQQGRPSPRSRERDRQRPDPPARRTQSTLDQWVTIGTGVP